MMRGDEPVESGELILRRFNPGDSSHLTQDEGTGEHQLRSGAFYLRDDEDGYSSNRRRILDANNLSIELVKEPPYVGLAVAEAAHIGNCEPPWEVRPDPWPDGYSPDRPQDVSHSLIVPSIRPNRTKIRRLVRRFVILDLS